MYAVIETGGKQYRVRNGDLITVEKLNVEAGQAVTFDKVLVLGEGKDVKVGTPYVDGCYSRRNRYRNRQRSEGYYLQVQG